MLDSVQSQTVLFMGPQGSGKGTQVELLKSYIEKNDSRPVVFFEMGRSLRKLAEAETRAGSITKEILDGGNLVPSAVSASLFTTYAMDNLKTGDEHLIIDGFPRTVSQIPMLDSALIDFYNRPSPVVLWIEVSQKESLKRLLLRGRHDDTEENIKKRLEWSEAETRPALDWFKNNAVYRVFTINGEQSVEDVFKDIRAALFNGNN